MTGGPPRTCDDNLPARGPGRRCCQRAQHRDTRPALRHHRALSAHPPPCPSETKAPSNGIVQHQTPPHLSPSPSDGSFISMFTLRSASGKRRNQTCCLGYGRAPRPGAHSDADVHSAHVGLAHLLTRRELWTSESWRASGANSRLKRPARPAQTIAEPEFLHRPVGYGPQPICSTSRRACSLPLAQPQLRLWRCPELRPPGRQQPISLSSFRSSSAWLLALAAPSASASVQRVRGRNSTSREPMNRMRKLAPAILRLKFEVKMVYPWSHAYPTGKKAGEQGSASRAAHRSKLFPAPAIQNEGIAEPTSSAGEPFTIRSTARPSICGGIVHHPNRFTVTTASVFQGPFSYKSLLLQIVMMSHYALSVALPLRSRRSPKTKT